MSTEIEEVRQWARALQAALYDARLPKEKQPRLYVDTDVVVGMFFRDKDVADAFSAPLGPPYSDRTLNVVVRSLWCAGFTPQAHLLDPHAVEVKHHLEDRTELKRSRTEAIAVQDLAQRVFNEDRVARLKKALATTERQVTEKTADEISELLPLPAFALAAASLKTWDDRLQLLGDQLEFSNIASAPEGFDAVSEIKASTIALCTTLQMIRAKEKKRLLFRRMARSIAVTQNTYSDVCALLQLEAFAKSGLVRFFSCSPTLLALIDRPDSQEHLPATLRAGPSDVLGASGTDNPEGVVRSAKYMLLRSVVPCLSFPDSREATVEGDTTADKEQLRLDLMVASARFLVRGAQSEVFGSSASEWLGGIHDLCRANSIQTVWRDLSSDAIKFIVDHAGPATMKETLASIDKGQGTIRAARLKKLTEIETRVKRLHSRVQTVFTSVNDPGMGRWMLLPALPAGNVPLLVGQAVLRLIEAEPDFTGTVDQWKRVFARESEAPRTRLVAGAVLLARGEDEFMATQGNWALKQEAAPDQPETAFSLALLVQCARLSSGKESRHIKELQEETKESFTALISPSGNWQIARCSYLMDAWRVFYWCHKWRRDNRRGVQTVSSTDVRQEAMKAVQEVVANMAAHLDEEMFLPMLEMHVHTLLLAENPDEARKARPTEPVRSDPYDLDCKLWLRYCLGNVRKTDRQRLLYEFDNYPAVCERYMREHREWMIADWSKA